MSTKHTSNKSKLNGYEQDALALARTVIKHHKDYSADALRIAKGLLVCMEDQGGFTIAAARALWKVTGYDENGKRLSSSAPMVTVSPASPTNAQWHLGRALGKIQAAYEKAEGNLPIQSDLSSAEANIEAALALLNH